MGDAGSKTGTRRGRAATTSKSISVGGVVKTADGNYAVKLRIGGQSFLVSSGKKADAAEVKRRIAGLGNNISSSVVPQSGGSSKITLKGGGGSVSFSAKKS